MNNDKINEQKIITPLRRRLGRWIKIIVLLYASIGIALFYLQEKFLFHPVSLPRDYQYHFDLPFKEVEFAINETDTINMVHFFPKDSTRKGIVIYYHGNKGNINRYAKFAENFTKNGYEVLMEDYPGFGKSVGDRSEKNLYNQAEQVYKLALSKYQADSIIVYGKSFGTGLASYVACVNKCKRLILETPYYSIPALYSCYAPIYPTTRMAKYRLPTNEFLAETSKPITIFHGTDDGVIPYRCAKKLQAVLKPADEFITIKGGSHHDLNDFDLFHRVMDSLLRN